MGNKLVGARGQGVMGVGGEVGVVMDMGVAMDVGVAMERLHDNPWDDGNVLYLDCINVKLQVVILFYSFTACYHQGKRERDTESL